MLFRGPGLALVTRVPVEVIYPPKKRKGREIVWYAVVAISSNRIVTCIAIRGQLERCGQVLGTLLNSRLHGTWNLNNVWTVEEFAFRCHKSISIYTRNLWSSALILGIFIN